jgi:hypothetical protein
VRAAQTAQRTCEWCPRPQTEARVRARNDSGPAHFFFTEGGRIFAAQPELERANFMIEWNTYYGLKNGLEILKDLEDVIIL